MTLILPDSRFEMPQMFYPNRKPIGNVKIDWSHPLAQGLRGCYLLRNNGVNLVDGAMEESSDGVSYGHDELFFNNTGGIVIGDVHDGYNNLSVVTSYYFDFGALEDFDTLSARRGAAGYEFQLRLKMSGIVSLLTTGGSFDSAGGKASSGKYNKLGFTSTSAGAAIIYHNGSTTTSTGKTRTTKAVKFEIGANTLGTLHFLNGKMPYQFVYDRILSAFEMNSIHDNPYQFLIP